MERRPNEILSSIRERIKEYKENRNEQEREKLSQDFRCLFSMISSYLMGSDSYVGFIMCALEPEMDEISESAIRIQLELDASYLKYNPFLLSELSLSTIMFVIASEIENIFHAVPSLPDTEKEKKGSQLMAIERYLEFQLSPTMNFDDPQMKDIDEKSYDNVLEMSDIPFDEQMEISENHYQKIKDAFKGVTDPKIKDIHGQPSDLSLSDICSFEYVSVAEKNNEDIYLDSFFIKIGQILIAQGTDKMRGAIPGEVFERIEKRIKEKPLDWKKLLRCTIANVPNGKRKTRLRLNRRQPNRSDISGEISDRVPSITIAIDTSGSISNQDFSRIVNQVYAICDEKKCAFTLIECDARICRVTEVKKKKDIPSSMVGRGGTSFESVIEYINKEGRRRNQILVYFTDGFGERRITKPKVHKMIWVLIGKGARMSLEEPYGIVIKDLNQ